MINLNVLILLPIVFISILLMLSTHSLLKSRIAESNNLKQVIILEENEYTMTYLLHKYYSNLRNSVDGLNSVLFPYLRNVSFSQQSLK